MKSIVRQWTLFVLTLIFNNETISAQTHTVKIEIDTDQIEVNKPFKITFLINSAYPIYLTDMQNSQPISNDFKVIINGIKSTSLSIKDGHNEYACKYPFMLIPNRSGECIILPWRTTLSHEIYVSDTLRINISDKKISLQDSLKQIENFQKGSEETFASLFNKNPFRNFDPHLRPDTINLKLLEQKLKGIYFNYADSIYNAKKDKPFDAIYSFSIVNMPGTEPVSQYNITRDSIILPDGVIKQTQWQEFNNADINGNHTYTYKLTLRLISSKSGMYSIPPIGLLYYGKRYMSQPLKIVVEE